MTTRAEQFPSPHLVAEVVDQLASYSEPVPTSAVGMAVTNAMRRLVNRGVVQNEDVMSWNPIGYWEVTGVTVVNLLSRRDDVVMTGVKQRNGYQGRKEKHWALKANAERWAKEREAREQALVEADTRFTIHEDPVQGSLKVLDTARGYSSAPEVVATFDTDALPLDVARDLAQRAKRALVRQAVAS